MNMNKPITTVQCSNEITVTVINMGRKFGAFDPFWGGDGSPSNTKSPGLRPTSIPSGIFMHPAIWLNRNRPKIRERVLPPFWGGGLGPGLTQCRLGRGLPTYQVVS